MISKWDKKWRVILINSNFPIYKNFKKTITNFGFVEITDGFFVYPYDCKKLLKKIFSTNGGEVIKYYVFTSVNQVSGLLIEINEIKGLN